MSEHAVAQPQGITSTQEATKVPSLLQRRNMNQPEPPSLQEWWFDTAPGAFVEFRFGYDFSWVPAFTGMKRQNRPLFRTQPGIQRFAKNEEGGTVPISTCPEAESSEISATAEPTAETPASEETTASGFIVEDTAETVGPGQMRRSDFLSQLRVEVNRAAEAVMVGTGRTTADCPYLEYWFGYYSRQDSLHLERTIRKYAPETAHATSARDYIPIIAERVRRSVETWARTGEIAGIPKGLSMGLPGMGLGIGGLISGIGSIFFKAREGGGRAPDDPRAVQAELGAGQPLEGGVRSRMESAFSMDFSHVRTHTDTTAAVLSNRFNARAFTVGKNIAFGNGEYKPGTIIGDALIAHELSHVMQQGNASPSVLTKSDWVTDASTLEEDADLSATGAIASLWCGVKEKIFNTAANAALHAKTGLRIQRCATTSTSQRRELQPVPVQIRQPVSAPCSVHERQSGERINPCCTATMIEEIENYVGQAIPIVSNAISRLSSSPEAVRRQLWDHFRIRPDDTSRITIVLNQFESMLNEMQGNDVVYICSDFADPLCGGGYRGLSSNCQTSRPRYLRLCGDYIWHIEDPSSKYLSTRSSIDWVKTIIHEYAHIGCARPSGILGGGEANEFYRYRGIYPPENPDIAIKNADSYAWFAMEAR